MKKLIVIIIGVGFLTGCTTREVKREVVTINGQDFLCSHTENKISGNETDPNCTPIDP